MQLAAGSLTSKLISALIDIFMTFLRPMWRVAIFVWSASLCLAFAQIQTAPADTLPPLPKDATQYVRETIKHQLEADAADHSHWRYRIHREDDKGSQDRDVIDTKDGQLARTLLIDGKPLTPEQRTADEARMKKLVQDPSERAKREKRAKDDDDKATQMLKAIPDAFVFKYEGDENGQVVLSFFPNPHYTPPARDLQVYRSMSGKMWIYRAEDRLARMDGSLFEDVTFGWGLLGRLNKGGTFSVMQRRVGDDHWVYVSLDVKMVGHAVVFKSINVRQVERLTDFHRMNDDITISQAYELLQKDESPVSAKNQSAVTGPGKN